VARKIEGIKIAGLLLLFLYWVFVVAVVFNLIYSIFPGPCTSLCLTTCLNLYSYSSACSLVNY